MNSHRLAFLLCSLGLSLSAADALAFVAPPETGVIINETFDGYADQAAFEAVWQPTAPVGTNPPPSSPPYGVLIPEGSGWANPPNDFPPDLQGQAVFIQNRLNVYAGPALSELQTLVPTIAEPIRLSADMFDDALPNKRVSIGIRNSTQAFNVIELGRWNAFAVDPTDGRSPHPNDGLSTGFAYRIINFGTPHYPLVMQPNYQYFPLDQSLENPLDADALVTPADIGPGWHRYSATIGVDFVTLMLDLFRDGLNNATGLPGVDSEVTWNIAPRGLAPFDSLRIGAPTGFTSIYGAVVDNIILERVQTIPEPAALSLASVTVLASVRKLRRR